MAHTIQDPHLEEFLSRVKQINAEGTWEVRRYHLRAFDQWLQENDYAAEELEAHHLDRYFIEEVGSGLAPKTIGGRWETLQLLYDKLAGLFDVIEETPFEDLDRSEYIDANAKKHIEADISYVTPEEKDAIVEHVPSPKLRNKLLVRLMWQTGIRKQETADIKLENIDRDERSILVESEKTDDKRTVFYQANLDFLMDQWLDSGYRDSYPTAEDSPYLFVTSRAEKFKYDRINDIIKEGAENAGVQEVMYEDAAGKNRYRITAHALRHGYTVQSLKNDMPLTVLRDLLGHESVETTQKYLQLVDDDRAEMARKYGAGTEQTG